MEPFSRLYKLLIAREKATGFAMVQADYPKQPAIHPHSSAPGILIEVLNPIPVTCGHRLKSYPGKGHKSAWCLRCPGAGTEHVQPGDMWVNRARPVQASL